MKTPRILFFQTPRIWLSLLFTASLLLAGCGGAGGGAGSVAGTGEGVSNSNIRVNGQLVSAQVQAPAVTSGSDDAACEGRKVGPGLCPQQDVRLG